MVVDSDDGKDADLENMSELTETETETEETQTPKRVSNNLRRTG